MNSKWKRRLSLALAGVLLVVMYVHANNLEVYLCLLASIVASAFLIKKYVHRPFDLIDPFVLFLVLAFIAYPVKYYVYDNDPALLLYSAFGGRIQYDESDYVKTIVVYFIGYVGFVSGYLATKSRMVPFSFRKVQVRVEAHALRRVLALTASIAIVSNILLYKFEIGLLFGNSPILGGRLVGILYYFFVFGSGFLLLLYMNAAIRTGARFHVIAALGMLLISSLLSVLSYSKSGMFFAFIHLLMMAILLKDSGKLPGYLKYTIVAALTAFLLLYPVIQVYRFASLASGEERGISSISTLANVVESNMFDSDFAIAGLWTAFDRVPGFDVLLPIVAYGEGDNLLSGGDLMGHLAGGTGEEGDYATFFKTEILGVSPLNPTGFEVTLLGFLYIYFRSTGVAVGMILWGAMNALLFEKVKAFYFSNPIFGFPLLVTYSMTFMGVTFGFGGNAIFMTAKTAMATGFLLLFWMKVFGDIGRRTPETGFGG